MSKKKPKTEGLEWLSHSLVAFNGSGYAEKTTPEEYVNSYIYYNAWKKRKNAVDLARKHRVEAEAIAEHFIDGNIMRTPNPNQYQKYLAFRQRVELML